MALIDLLNDEINDIITCIETYGDVTQWDWNGETQRHYEGIIKKLRDHLDNVKHKQCPRCDRYQLDADIQYEYESWLDPKTRTIRDDRISETVVKTCRNCGYREEKKV